MSSLLTKNFIPFPDITGRSSTSPLARERDQYDMVREYRAPPEEDPRSTAPSSSRKHHNRPAPPAIGPTINIVPAGPEVPFNRIRERDLVPSSTFTHPSRRVSEREYNRNHREQQILERNELPRRPVEPANQIPEESKRHYDRELSRPHPSDFDRSSPDHVGQTSRTCLPTTVWTCIPTSVSLSSLLL